MSLMPSVLRVCMGAHRSRSRPELPFQECLYSEKTWKIWQHRSSEQEAGLFIVQSDTLSETKAGKFSLSPIKTGWLFLISR